MTKKPSSQLVLLFILLVSAYMFAKFQGGFVSWFLVYAFLPIAVYIVLYYAWALKGVRLERKVNRQTFMAGESLTVTFELRNPYRFPLVYVFIDDRIPPKWQGRTKGRQSVVYPWFKNTFNLTYTIDHLPRGVFMWDEVQLQTGDLFGFVTKQRTFHQTAQITVYPRYEEIRHWPAYQGRNAGQSVTMGMTQAEDVTSVLGTRSYVPGDRLSRIHWKASAKAGSLRTKEFDQQVTNNFMFFLDREKKSFGDENHPLFEKSVTVTASLVRYALKRHFSAGLTSYGQTHTRLNVNRDPEQLYRIFEHLAAVKADGTFSYAKMVLREVNDLPVGTTAVLVSPRLDKKMVQLLGELKQRHIPVEFFWIKDDGQSAEEKRFISFLEAEQVAHHIVTGPSLDQLLLGGKQHVSA